MKSVKGKMMKKLKSIRSPEYLKPDNFLQAGTLDELVDNISSLKSNLIRRPIKIPIFKDLEQHFNQSRRDSLHQRATQQEEIDVERLVRELEKDEDEETHEKPSSCSANEMLEENKENLRPSIGIGHVSSLINNPPERLLATPHRLPLPLPAETDDIGSGSGFSFRRPDMNSVSLFDPNLLEEFKLGVKEFIKSQEESHQPKAYYCSSPSSTSTSTSKSEETWQDELDDPLVQFEAKCPPGGSYSVIIYTTSLRGIRKTFEDCHSLLFLLESFRVIFQERDISMHSEFRQEMWTGLGEENKGLLPPRLFIKGRYIGGAEEVLGLHEQGRLKPLFQGLPKKQRCTSICQGCGGFRFLVCCRCNGSRKVCDTDTDDDRKEEIDGNCGSVSEVDNRNWNLKLNWKRCPECNENGLTVCQYC